MLKKILTKFVVLVFTLYLILFQSSVALAASGDQQGTWYNQDFKTWLGKVDDTSNPSEIFGERYTAAQVQWIIYSLLSFIIHTNLPEDVVSCVLTNTVDLGACKDSIEKFLTPTSNSGAKANTKESVASEDGIWTTIFLRNRPMSGISYVRSKLTNFSITPEAQAQSAGFGFDALKPVQDMWRATRNVAFSFFVFAIVIFSFMIMFRVKISPQLVISAQSSIPKVITALILATFSYAIAGFFVDIMYIVIGILSIILSNFIPSLLSANIESKVIFNLLTVGQPTSLPIQLGIFGLMGLYITPLVVVLVILTVLGIFATPFTAGLSFFIPFIILIIVIIVALWVMIKTVWGLVKAFANILLLTVFAPIQFALGVVVPKMGFSEWARSFFANLSVFVITGALYWFSIVFLIQGAAVGLTNSGINLVPILASNLFNVTVNDIVNAITPQASWPPLLGGGGPETVGLLYLGVSFVLFTLIPKASEIVQGFISGKPFAYGSAVGEVVSEPINSALRLNSIAGDIGRSYSTRFGTRNTNQIKVKDGPSENEIDLK